MYALKNSNYYLLKDIKMHIRSHYEKTVILHSMNHILISRISWPESIFIQLFQKDGIIPGDFAKHKEAKWCVHSRENSGSEIFFFNPLSVKQYFFTLSTG